MLLVFRSYPLKRFVGHALGLAAAMVALVPFEELPAEAPPQTTERAVGFDELSRAYVALAIQGDLRRAPALFQDSVGGGAAGAALQAQFNERFIQPSDAPSMQPSTGAVAEDVALAWRGYWRQSLLRSVEAEQAEADLTFALAEIQRAHSAEPSPNSGPERLTRPGACGILCEHRYGDPPCIPQPT